MNSCYFLNYIFIEFLKNLIFLNKIYKWIPDLLQLNEKFLCLLGLVPKLPYVNAIMKELHRIKVSVLILISIYICAFQYFET